MLKNIKKSHILLFIVIIAVLALHTCQTVRDAHDIDVARTINLPNDFLNAPLFKNLRETIIDKPLYFGPDSYYWVLYASEAAQDGKWRLHHCKYDNAPYGRAMHWHSGYLWYLMGLGKLYAHIHGTTVTTGIEQAASWSNPILIALFALFWTIIIAKKTRPSIAAIFFIILLSPLWGIHGRAVYGYVDHHLEHAMLFLSTFLAILLGGAGFIRSPYTQDSLSPLGCLTPPSYLTARFWFILSSLFGGLSIWAGATEQAMLIGLIGIGGLVAAFLFTKENMSILTTAPQLWRLWGIVGCSVTLILYLIEYFPDNMEMRLEVIHPLYAVAWLGGGEFIYRTIRLLQGNLTEEEKNRDRVFLFLSCIGIFLLPCAILFGPDQWHSIHNDVVRRMHSIIWEFKPAFKSIKELFSYQTLLLFGLLPGYCLLMSCWLLIRRKSSDQYHRILIYTAAIPTIGSFLLYALQNRWGIFFAVTLIMFTTILASARFRLFPKSKTAQILIPASILALLIPSCYFYVTSEGIIGENTPQRLNKSRFNNLTFSLLTREFAINLLDRTQSKEIRVLASPGIAPILAFYGGGHSVGSLYWENGEGMSAATLFFSTSDFDEAKKIAQERSITHLIIHRGSAALARQSCLTHFGTTDKSCVEKSFGYHIAMNPDNPTDWLSYFTLFYFPRSQNDGFVIYRVNLDDEKRANPK